MIFKRVLRAPKAVKRIIGGKHIFLSSSAFSPNGRRNRSEKVLLKKPRVSAEAFRLNYDFKNASAIFFAEASIPSFSTLKSANDSYIGALSA